METQTTTQAAQDSNAQNVIGNDAFVRTADALSSAADSLVLEYQRREQMGAEQRKKEEAQSIELRTKLVNIHQKIGQLLGVVGPTVATTVKRGRPFGSKNAPKQPEPQRGRAMSDETIKAKDNVLAYITANKGVSRGDIAKNCKIDTSLVGRVLQMLAEDGLAKMEGERRGALWSSSSRKH